MPKASLPVSPWMPGAIFGGLGLIFVVVGWVLVLMQASLLNRAVATDALVREAYVETASSVQGPDSHKARVRYNYAVGDEVWGNDRVFPHDIRVSSRRVMRRVVQRFPVDSLVTAWVDPEDPERSFLLKELLWLPYVIALAPVLFVIIGATIALPAWAVPLPVVGLLGSLWWHQRGMPEAMPGWMQLCYVLLLAFAFLPAIVRGRRRT